MPSAQRTQEACLGGTCPYWLSLGRVADVLSVPPLMARQGLTAVGPGGQASHLCPSPQAAAAGTIQLVPSPASRRVVGLVLCGPRCRGHLARLLRVWPSSPPDLWVLCQPERVHIPRAQSVPPWAIWSQLWKKCRPSTLLLPGGPWGCGAAAGPQSPLPHWPFLTLPAPPRASAVAFQSQRPREQAGPCSAASPPPAGGSALGRCRPRLGG